MVTLPELMQRLPPAAGCRAAWPPRRRRISPGTPDCSGADRTLGADGRDGVGMRWVVLTPDPLRQAQASP